MMIMHDTTFVLFYLFLLCIAASTKFCVLYVRMHVNDNHAFASQSLISHVSGSHGNKSRSLE
jgi:hypothetical protein